MGCGVLDYRQGVSGDFEMQGLTPVIVAAALLTAGAVGGAVGAECPGNPDALGVSRTIVVDPVEHPRLGSMQYRESLPLEDHEVVLTFDDGPLPPRTNHILDILAHECVKATFFMVGQMATTYPDVARKVLAAGHTVGTHSQNHPLRLHKMPLAKAEQEIDQGIVSVETMRVDGPAVRLAVAGQASLPTRDLDLKGVATLVSTATADEFELPFVVQGPWDDPIMLPDAQSLIRRSGAAAPLIDSAKARNASDAVRAVIDQLLAAPPAPAASTPAASKASQ